jgi:hypothetical protein
VGNTANVLANDILFYTNGDVGLGYHFTAVTTVKAKQPETLQWKYQYSGAYKLVRTMNLFETPMYWPTQDGPLAANPKDWGLFKKGAGDSDTMTVYTR